MGVGQEVRSPEGRGGEIQDGSSGICLLPALVPVPAGGGGRGVATMAWAKEMSTDGWQRWEQGLVDCKLSIMAQIISILRRALCTMPRKSNTLKG